jgi:pilus assembly protein FimV
VRRISLALVAAAIGLAVSSAAQAAGLGRLIVLSSLGAPLVAEIELVSLQPGEEDGLTARIASAEAFRQAGIEPSAALIGVRFAMIRRDGRPVIRVTSPQPVNDPFVDLLVELEWNGGRLVREYTVLLDPPEFKGPQAIAAAPLVPAWPVAQPLPPLEAAPQAQVAALAPESRTSAPAAEKPAEKAAAAGRSAAASTHEVKRGDTLGAIARANLPAGVTLNQMLIAIYRANQDAFLRENINLVRAGRILNLPTAESARGVSAQEANELVQSHRAEWDEYRSRIAARPAPAEAASGQRAVTGKIAAKPEAAPSGAAEEQVRLSKADPVKPGAADRAARADDAAARERALKEAQSRVTDLEKNVADLHKLLELKNQQLAELEKKSAAKPAAKAEPAKPEAAKREAAKPAPPPVVAAAPAPAPSAAVTAPGASASITAPGASASVTAPGASASVTAPGASAPVTAPPASAPAAAPAPAPAPEAKKAEPAKPKPKAVTPPPPPPPSLLDEFLDNQIALGGVALVVLVLLSYAMWSLRRKKAIQAKFSDSVMGPAGGAPAFNEPGGAAGGSHASISQTSGMEAEEVDPIAEADVYMAYGRDAQAEEILREALQKDPNRIPVHAKLLEIYAKRNDIQAFEQTALKLKSLTNGSGQEWDKATALGRSIDPANGLYGASAPATETTATAPAMGGFAAAAAAAPTIDFDIGGGTSSSMVTTDIPLDDPPRTAAPSTIDFDLGAGTTPPSTRQPDPDATVLAPLDFDLNIGGEENKAPPPALAAAGDSASGLDFDLNLDLDADKPAMADQTAPAMDLSSISLDLGSAGEAGGAASSNDPKWQEVATKLDLAKAYEEMGDRDGARELLSEVMKDGDAAQKGQAQQLLTKLG